MEMMRLTAKKSTTADNKSVRMTLSCDKPTMDKIKAMMKKYQKKTPQEMVKLALDLVWMQMEEQK